MTALLGLAIPKEIGGMSSLTARNDLVAAARNILAGRAGDSGVVTGEDAKALIAELLIKERPSVERYEAIATALAERRLDPRATLLAMCFPGDINRIARESGLPLI